MTDQAEKLRRLMRGASDAYIGAGNGLATLLPPSVPTGVVSYGPPRPRKRTSSFSPPKVERLARAIAVTSGKGGVGKTNIAVNLAVSLAKRGKRVCLLDADLGLANVDVLCNLTPSLTLEHVVTGRCRLSEVMLLAPGGFRLIPGASGVTAVADMGSAQRYDLLSQLTALERVVDMIIIDTGAGIGNNVMSFASAAHSILIVTTPEPTAVIDSYGTIKALTARDPNVQMHVVINMAETEAEAKSVFQRMARACKTFLHRELKYAGMLQEDIVVRESVRQRLPFLLYAPSGLPTRQLHLITNHIAGEEAVALPAERGFFSRLLRRCGGRDSAVAEAYE